MRVNNKTATLSALEAQGCVFSEPVSQSDTIYVHKTGNLETFLSNEVFVRIREQSDGSIILTAKQSASRVGGDPLVKKEHEVKIDSAKEGRTILEMTGLVEAVRVAKCRQIAHYKDWEVCIDEVDGLGTFIELEEMAPEENAANIQDAMVAFLTSVGIPSSDRVFKGYDILMLENLTQI